MEREEIVEIFSQFVRENYYEKLIKAVSENTGFLLIDFSLLDKYSPELASYLLENPEETIEACEEALKQIDTGLAETELRLRFVNLPEDRQIRIRNIRSQHLGKMLVVDGFVKRASEIRPEVCETVYECLECGNTISITQKERILKTPERCEACGSRRGFKLTKQKFYDTRWIVVEEPYEITTGERPSELMIYLKEDLTSPKMQNKTEPGNRIKVVGILKELPRRIKGTRSRQMEIYLDANSVESVEVGWEEFEITPEDEKKILELAKNPEIYSKFIVSIAPTMYGMEEVKEALLLQLVGGEPHLLEDGTRIRGNIHILLVGDPACLIGDERVFLGDGTMTKIKNLGSYHLQDISVPVRVRGKEIEIAKTFHIYNNQPVIEIITESGKSLKGSLNQPVLVVEGQKRKWKRLDELKIGDRVAVVPSISCWKKSLVLTGWEKTNRKFGPQFHGKIPDKWYPELGAFVGYLLGDGYVRENKGEIVAFVNENETDLIEPLVKYIENLFGLKPIVEKFKGHSHTYQGRKIESKKYLYRIILRSKDLAKNLKFLKEKRVPHPIFLSPNAVVKEFLKWLFQADGSVFYKGRGRRGIQLKQKEIELLRDVQMLLLRFGIHSRIYGNNLTIRRGYDILKFAKSIGFVSNNKKTKLSELSEYAKKFKRVKRQLSERIVAINKLKGFYTVYDIEVPKSHRFIANGIIVHNSGKSQLMQYISKLIPRGRYVSGSGVTGVGLTAAVIRDEEFLGGWVLEGGAIVMSNKSVCCIDEFSKVTPGDRVALQEAMSLETISIAKASIVATLPAQTAILAGANPKLGRFDPYLPIREQVDIDDVLLSRFDLKFALRDIPNPEIDSKMAEHILKVRHLKTEEAKPIIPPEFLRKYIAYARAKVHPVLTKEAGELLMNFYLEMRKKSGEEAPIAITLRQYEALIRLAEASAKIQLRNFVTKEDAERAIRLMKISLREFGFEPETGMFDIDRAEGQRVTAAQRSKIRVMIDILEELTTIHGKNIPQEEFLKRAKEEGVENAEEIMRKMISEGIIFQPKPGFIQKV
jgi:DNA replicative helicase MCM subunit Mcm2 (Cdc46/Mcm family)